MLINWEKDKYNKIKRLENAYYEEKIDGSNFCFIKNSETNELEFYSRNCKLEQTPDKKIDNFFTKFIDYIKEIDKTHTIPTDLFFFGEAIGQAEIKYFVGQQKETKDKLYIFDIRNKDGRFCYRKTMEEICEPLELNVVPLVKINDTKSVVDPNVEREGMIIRIEESMPNVLKLKVVERKKNRKGEYKQKIKIIENEDVDIYGKVKQEKRIIENKENKFCNECDVYECLSGKLHCYICGKCNCYEEYKTEED